MDPQHLQHKKHRHILYSLIVILTIVQIIVYAVFTVHIAKLNILLRNEISKSDENVRKFTGNLIENYDSAYQENFKQISDAVRDQQRNLEVIKSGQDDFSDVIKGAVRGVVTISTENTIGTGFIVKEGYVISNYHIIKEHEDSIKIITYDKKTESATLIGKDEGRDIALLKMPKQENYFLELANSDELEVGNKVIAIGNPLGLTFTVTEGIVSGLHRVGPNGIAEYIQTDVSLNPGNSGGPLINTQGKVVGINNFKIGGAENLGFALESNSIKESMERIAAKK